KDDDISGVRKSKTSDLKNRLKLINENKDAICISIHQNKFKDSSSCGAQIFYGIKNENSKLLAQSIQTTFTEIQPDNKRQIKPSTSSVYIIHNAQIPTVLVECGFLSNKNDAV
ncbi:MAG: N-acetylmuramoyl-L-alanine amidase, partial [Oscillospiraceae bacterium]